MSTQAEDIKKNGPKWRVILARIQEESRDLQDVLRNAEYDGDLAKAEEELHRFCLRLQYKIKQLSITES